MVKFSEIIKASWEWTKTVLFRGFFPKKWLILILSAWLSGSLFGGFSLNIRIPVGSEKKASVAEPRDASFSLPSPQGQSGSETTALRSAVTSGKNNKNIIVLWFIAALTVLALFILFFWLCCRFIFIFLQNVATNEAAIKNPFRQNKEEGNSLFLFSLAAVAALFVSLLISVGACLFVLFKMGVFSKAASGIVWLKVILASLPFLAFIVLLFIAYCILNLLAYDFVAVIMFNEKISFIPALRKLMPLIKNNRRSFVVYILLRWGLSIAAGAVNWILSLAACLSMLIIAVVPAGFLYLIYKLLPAAFHMVYFVILAVVLLPLSLLLFYCSFGLFLPSAVFLRTFSLKFIARLEPRYNLFIKG